MNGYYVYRFINYDDDIVYVGRTVNLLQRFTNHSFLTDAIRKLNILHAGHMLTWRGRKYIISTCLRTSVLSIPKMCMRAA